VVVEVWESVFQRVLGYKTVSELKVWSNRIGRYRYKGVLRYSKL
jgi:hypothetical protein